MQDACNPAAEFGQPSPVSEVNTQVDESSARISPDGTELYLSRTAPSHPKNREIWRYVRTGDGPWQGGVVIDSLRVFNNGGSAHQVNNMTFENPNAAFLSVYNNDVVSIHRSSRQGLAWSAPVSVQVGKPGSISEMPWFAPLTQRMYFSGLGRMLVAPSNGASFPLSQQLRALNATTEMDFGPVLTADEKTMYYTGTKSGATTRRIYRTIRTNATLDFGPEQDVLVLNGNDGPDSSQVTWVSPDGCEVYFVSNRPGGVGLGDLYRARKPL
jgi:WD40-like Beta Propeller Repeat